jgi:hypothetical protein
VSATDDREAIEALSRAFLQTVRDVFGLTLAPMPPTLQPMTLPTGMWAWYWRHERGGSVA